METCQRLRIVSLLAIAFSSNHTFALTEQELVCGTLNPEGANIGMYGPYDYTKPENKAEHLRLVEHGHFDHNVEFLIKGKTSELPYGDLNYTLLAFPNHHRALNTLINLAMRDKTNKPKYMTYSVDCFFNRAIRFQPKDSIAGMLYGIYLMKIKRNDEALKQFKLIGKALDNYAEFHYDLGLLYVEMQDWQNAAIHAAKAYKLGYPLPGLKKKLISAGKWGLVEKQ